MRKIEVDIYDCKADKERPQIGEQVHMKYNNKWYPGRYFMALDNKEYFNSPAFVPFIPFTEADEWYRPIKGE